MNRLITFRLPDDYPAPGNADNEYTLDDMYPMYAFYQEYRCKSGREVTIPHCSIATCYPKVGVPRDVTIIDSMGNKVTTITREEGVSDLVANGYTVEEASDILVAVKKIFNANV